MQQSFHLPNNASASADSKTQLSAQQSQPFDFIVEASEPTSENLTSHKRGYELGTRPPPVPPKSPLDRPAEFPAIPGASARLQNAPLGDSVQRYSFEDDPVQKPEGPPKPPSSQITENSAVLIERHRELIQRHAARKGEFSRHLAVQLIAHPTARPSVSCSLEPN